MKRTEVTAQRLPPERHVAAGIGPAMVDICVGRSPQTSTDPGYAAEFVRSVQHHRIAPLAHVRLRESNPGLADRLLKDRYAALNTQIRMAALLRHVGHVLDGLPWAAVKGPVLSELAHPVRGLRTYHDLDLLVAPTDLGDVIAELRRAGWSSADDEAHFTLPRELPGETHWRSPEGTLVDLHWTLLNETAVRRRHTLMTEPLLRRRREVTVLSVPTAALDPVDAFVHVCLHAAESGANRLLLLLDVNELARSVRSWDEVAARAREWRAGPDVALVLHRARTTLGTPLPADVGRRLGVSSSFLALTGAVNHIYPVAESRGEDGPLRLVARSARVGTARTALAVAGKSLQWASGRIQGAPRPFPFEGTPARPGTIDSYVARVEAAARARPPSH